MRWVDGWMSDTGGWINEWIDEWDGSMDDIGRADGWIDG